MSGNFSQKPNGLAFRLAVGSFSMLAAMALSSLSVLPIASAETSAVAAPVELSGDDLLTRDGVRLCATFYPGTETKETIPLLLLHDWKGSAADFDALVEYLEPQGYAMLVPDLRGHGRSTTKLARNPRNGRVSETTLDARKFRTTDLQALARHDLRTLRRFLLEKNNEEKLNLNKLVIVAAGASGNIAMEWGIYDWLIPNYPGVKQGKDLKGLVLLSPQWLLPGFKTPQAVQHAVLRQEISIMIVVGKLDPRKLADAEKIVKGLKDNRPRPGSGAASESTVWFGKFETSDQGAQLLDDAALELPRHIERFLTERVQEAFPEATWLEHHTSK